MHLFTTWTENVVSSGFGWCLCWFRRRGELLLRLLHSLCARPILRVGDSPLSFPPLIVSSLTSNKLAYLFTPWFWILFEKLIVTQLVKTYPAFLWNPKAHYHVHTRPPLDPILNQLNPVRPIDPYLPKVQLNVILPPTPRSFQWSLPFGLPTKTL
jgi:hypothetical protein